MAKFPDLPNELVVEIWSYILQPKDIENFALASKTIRALGRKILVNHRKLTRELSAFDIGGSNSRFSAAGLLKEILKTPRVALYIRTLTFTGFHEVWESREQGVNTLNAFDPESGESERHYRHTPYMKEDMELFKQVIGRTKQFLDFKFLECRQWAVCHCFQSAKYRVNRLREIMEEGNEFPIIVLLLLLFTNLKTVVVEYRAADECFFHLLRHISEGAGIPVLKRPIKVKVLNAYEEKAEIMLRNWGIYILPSSTKGKTPGVMGHDHCFSFDLRAWSMNVDGMWTL